MLNWLRLEDETKSGKIVLHSEKYWLEAIRSMQQKGMLISTMAARPMLIWILISLEPLLYNNAKYFQTDENESSYKAFIIRNIAKAIKASKGVQHADS